MATVSDFISSFSNYVAFDEIKWLCTFNKYTAQIRNRNKMKKNTVITHVIIIMKVNKEIALFV